MWNRAKRPVERTVADGRLAALPDPGPPALDALTMAAPGRAPLPAATQAAVLSGDAREAKLTELAERIRPQVMAYLASIEETPERRAEIDRTILHEHVQPAVADYNREAGATGQKELDVRTAVIDVLNRLRGAGPLQRLMADPLVTDIKVRAGAHVYFERDGLRVTTDLTLSDDDCLYFVQRMLLEQGHGEPLGRNNPEVTIRTPRARITATHHSLAPRGTIIAIRMFPAEPWTGEALVASGMLPQTAWELLLCLMRAGLNGAIAGEMGTGKTTLTQALAAATPADLQLVTIEEPAEFNIQRERFDQLEVRPARPALREEGISARQLIRLARRLSPDVLIMGEVRGGEAWDMLSVMQMTPASSLCTLHAVYPDDVFDRLETMCLENPDTSSMPLHAVRKRIKDTISFAAVVQRLPLGGPAGSPRIRRVLTNLVELQQASEHGYTLEHILAWEDGQLCWTGKHFSSAVQRRLERVGVPPVDFSPFPRTSAARQFVPSILSTPREHGGET